MKSLKKILFMLVAIIAMSALTVNAQTAQERSSRGDDDERPEEGNISGGHIDIGLTTLSPATVQYGTDGSTGGELEGDESEEHGLTQKVLSLEGLNLKIFPNPATTDLYIDFGAELDARVSLHTILGQEVYGENVSTQNHRIYIGDFKQGVYFLNIVSEDDRVTRKVKLVP
ncbi:MAG: hypothetical protein ACI959_000590 [Limisphaerales bacterium]|jgi:hypothetical protein